MVKRPALRYHGGKWILAKWIIPHFPPHRVYTEVFGGAASVLLRKPKSYAEVYNDLEDDVVNYFRVLRDQETSARLKFLLENTPYARQEFEAAYEPVDDPVERARRLVIRSFMGFGSDGTNIDKKTGFRANSNRSGSTPAHNWKSWPDSVPMLTERLRDVVIEHKPATDILKQTDTPQTLHYVDPPYTLGTRKNKKRYVHEMIEQDHIELAETLYTLEGAVVLSGYRSKLYDLLYSGWVRCDREALADGARKRIESLWLNPVAAGALP